MNKPKRLKKGDTIGVVVPSNRVKESNKILITNFISSMKELGLKVVLSSDFYDSDKFKVSSGPAKTRADEINKMFADDSIDAIWCFQGGETANELLPHLDYELIKKNPKIIIGKSNIDLLLLALNKKCDMYTFHGCDAKYGDGKEFDYEYTRTYFEERLFNHDKTIVPYFPWKFMREGKCSGRILGCNSSSILKLLGTEFFPDFSDSILFLEGYCPDIRKVVSMIAQMKQIGVFDKINGLVIGHIYDFDDRGLGDNVNYEDVVFDLLQDYDFPVLKIDEFGHYFPHAFLPIGAKVEFDSSKAMEIKILDDFLE